MSSSKRFSWPDVYLAIRTSGFHIAVYLLVVLLFIVVGQTVDMVNQIVADGRYFSGALVGLSLSVIVFSMFAWFSLRMIFDLATLSFQQDKFVSTLDYLRGKVRVVRPTTTGDDTNERDYYAGKAGVVLPRLLALALPLLLGLYAVVFSIVVNIDYLPIAIYSFIASVVVHFILVKRKDFVSTNTAHQLLKIPSLFKLLSTLLVVNTFFAIFFLEVFSRYVSGLNLILIGLGSLLFGLTLVAYLIFDLFATSDKHSKRYQLIPRPYPLIIFAIGLPLLVGWLPWADNHSIRYVDSTVSVAKEYESIENAWLQFKRSDQVNQQTVSIDPAVISQTSTFSIQGKNKRIVPVFFIASEGGGLRAAYWTGLSLTHLESLLPGFQNNVFSLTGASGGTVGNVFYLASRQVSDEQILAADCEQTLPSATYEPIIAKRFCLLESAIGQDYLSPVTTSFFYNDLLYRYAPVPLPIYKRDRAIHLEQAFERGFNHSFLRALDDGKNAGLEQTYRKLYASSRNDKWQPLLIGTSTIQELGMMSVYAPFKVDASVFPNVIDLTSYLPKSSEQDMRLSTVALNSARFPYITPTGTLDASKSRAKKWHLADAGYFDNYGASVTQAMINHLFDEDLQKNDNETLYIPIPIILTNSVYQDKERPNDPQARFNNQYSAISNNASSSLAHELTSPLQTVISIRGGLANTMLHNLIKQQAENYPAIKELLEKSDDPNAAKLLTLMSPVAPFIVMNYQGKDAKESGTMNPPLGWWLSEESKKRLTKEIQTFGSIPD